VFRDGGRDVALAIRAVLGILAVLEQQTEGMLDLAAHRYVDSRAENGLTALHMAAALGDLECVQALLGAGASMMVRTVDLDMISVLQFPAGSTPLHLAAQRGHIAIVQAMLQVLPCPLPKSSFLRQSLFGPTMPRLDLARAAHGTDWGQTLHGSVQSDQHTVTLVLSGHAL
jgi:ankyrin repeat protein